jgi:hypothetical protein
MSRETVDYGGPHGMLARVDWAHWAAVKAERERQAIRCC